MPGKVFVISNTAWSIHNFRASLIRELRKHGFSVTAIAPQDEYSPRIADTGALYIPLPMDNSGTNPFKDLGLFMSLRRIFKRERPACVLSFTIKPNLYAALAARSLGIPTVSNISGLGTVFIKQNWVTAVVRLLYRGGLKAASTVFFQNPDDRDYFIQERLVSAAKTQLVPGSGIDTNVYKPARTAGGANGGLRFLLLGRILWDKGVGEYVEAAMSLGKRYRNCEFMLMGFVGAINATAITTLKINEWESSGAIKYVPPTDDVRTEIAKADCVVLPSYREGTPRSLLEAAAMGKPIITTDVPGCRQVVEDGRTGFLVKVRDSADLAAKMERMIHLPASEREAMGMRGRDKMISEFDERLVLNRYLQAVKDLT
jgi:glycosyltransferase involved in cell wall biosynthesis